jgi:sulfoxide reductase heme-binding subunit YedZ
MLNPTPKQITLVKTSVFVLALLPFARLLAFLFLDKLGAQPI